MQNFPRIFPVKFHAAFNPSSRSHVFDGFPRPYERTRARLAEAQANLQSEPLVVHATAQSYAFEEDVC